MVFTESRRTQEYLIRLLERNEYTGKIVLFNGSNADPESSAIYKEWLGRHKGGPRVTGSKSGDMRSALVDKFRDDAEILIATEAAAEGINLQFCSMIVNYDLPWNPQRIEQRIGRCHRYGQKHDVVVINFLNQSNAAEQRVFELLDEKFQLFSGVFGASDEILGAIESGVDFERRVASIFQGCRTNDEIDGQFQQLRLDLEAEITTAMNDTRRKLLESFDSEVHDRLRVSLRESQDYLKRSEKQLWDLTRAALFAHATFDDHGLEFRLHTNPDPSSEGAMVAIGDYTFQRGAESDAYRYRSQHPLAQWVIRSAADATIDYVAVEFDYTNWPATSEAIKPLVGTTGWIEAGQLSFDGVEAVDHLLVSGVTAEGTEIDEATARRILDLPVTSESSTIEVVLGGVAERPGQLMRNAVGALLAEAEKRQGDWFQDEIDKLDRWADDKRASLQGELNSLKAEIKDLKKQSRQAGTLAERLDIQKRIKFLEVKSDTAWKAYEDESKRIENSKDELITTVQARLESASSIETLFRIRYSIT